MTDTAVRPDVVPSVATADDVLIKDILAKILVWHTLSVDYLAGVEATVALILI